MTLLHTCLGFCEASLCCQLTYLEKPKLRNVQFSKVTQLGYELCSGEAAWCHRQIMGFQFKG